MKKLWMIILCVLPLLAFNACDDRDKIREDIDALNSRLDQIQAEFDRLNSEINKYYNLVDGKVFFTGYTQHENGDYTIELSDGSSWTIYSGKPAGEIPVVGINENGEWTFTYNGETIILGGTAFPEDGKDGSTPKITIDEEGYWCYQIGDGEPQRIPGPYNVAQVDKIHPSIFEDVKIEGDNILFKLYGSEEYVNVPLLGGLDLQFSNEHVIMSKGTTEKLTATQTLVHEVVISPSPLQVVLSENGPDNLMITAPDVVETGDYVIYFEIYSREGYRLVKSLKVTVE